MINFKINIRLFTAVLAIALITPSLGSQKKADMLNKAVKFLHDDATFPHFTSIQKLKGLLAAKGGSQHMAQIEAALKKYTHLPQQGISIGTKAAHLIPKVEIKIRELLVTIFGDNTANSSSTSTLSSDSFSTPGSASSSTSSPTLNSPERRRRLAGFSSSSLQHSFPFIKITELLKEIAPKFNIEAHDLFDIKHTEDRHLHKPTSQIIYEYASGF